MRLYPLALMAGLLPLLSSNATYLLAASDGQVPWCFPYIDSCTSISATGRAGPAYYVFKGLMIPAAMVLMAYWLLNAQWLKVLGAPRGRWLFALVALGILASLGLIFYSLVLGAIGPEFRQQRHVGVLTFFGFTFLAQLLITKLAHQVPGLRAYFRGHLRTLSALMFADLLLGVTNVLIGFTDPALYNRINNAFAWNFTLLLCFHVLVTANLWRATGWRFTFSANRYQ